MLLKIKNLKLQTIIGIFDWEQTVNRDIIINITIELKDNKVLVSNDISDTIDYDKTVSFIKEMAKNKKFKLVETMAQEIANKIMSDEKVKECIVEIDKVGAVENLESFSVAIKKTR